MLSQPVRIYWAGWETDTYRLQAEGWEISAQEDIQRRKMNIALRHADSGMRGFCEGMDWDYFRNMERQQQMGMMDSRNLPTFHAQLASDIIVNHPGAMMSEDIPYHAIDARPMMQNLNMEGKSVDSFAHFRRIEKPSDEIYLRKASMAEILEMALQKQEPKQEEIRQQMVRDNELKVMRTSQLRANLRLVG